MLSLKMTLRWCETVCACKEFQMPIDLFYSTEWLNKLFGGLYDKFNDLRNVSLNKFLRGKVSCFVFILSIKKKPR